MAYDFNDCNIDGFTNREVFIHILNEEFGDEPRSTWLDECNADRFTTVCEFMHAVMSDYDEMMSDNPPVMNVEAFRAELLNS